VSFADINTEDRLAQKTFADHLEQQLGRENVYAWNMEGFGTPPTDQAALGDQDSGNERTGGMMARTGSHQEPTGTHRNPALTGGTPRIDPAAGRVIASRLCRDEPDL
jgi:hypothetical protein